MAENTPPGQEEEGGQEPFPAFISLPHAHPATSFSNDSQADLDRQAMPPPPHPSATVPVLDATTPVFEPRVLHPFRLDDAGSASFVAHFKALGERTTKILSSLTSVRGLDEEVRVINRAIEVNDEGQRLYNHIIDGLVGVCGLGNGESGLIRADWRTFMDEEFHAEAARHERCGRDLIKRKAIVQTQLDVRDQIGLLAKDEAEMARQGITGPVGADFMPLAVGVPEPVYNQKQLPQEGASTLFTAVPWLQHDSMHVSSGTRLPNRQHGISFSASPQTLAVGIPENRRGSQSAFARQFESVSSPTPIHRASTRRNDSFGGSSQSSRQDFQTGIRSEHYRNASSRRTDRQGSFDNHAESRRWSSNSPPKQNLRDGITGSEWQHTQYKDATASQAGHSSQYSRGKPDLSGYNQYATLDKGKGREISPHRGRSATKVHEREESQPPSKKHSQYSQRAKVHDTSKNVAADHSHPTPPASVSSKIENVDMLTAWGQQHTPKASHRRRSGDSDVPPFKLDDQLSVDGANSSLNLTHSTISETGTLPPSLAGKDSALGLDLEQGVKPIETIKTPKGQNVQSNKQELKLLDNIYNGERSANVLAKPTSEKANVAAAKESSEEASQIARRISDSATSEALKRKQSNEWQVAQPKNRRAAPSQPNPKNNNQHSKDKDPVSEEARAKKTKKKGSHNEPGAEHEVSTGKNRKKKGGSHDSVNEREASGDGEKKSTKHGNGSRPASRGQKQKQDQGFDTVEGDKSYRPSKKGKEREVGQDYTVAFPSLAIPAIEPSQKAAETVKCWSAALQSTDLRVEAEKLRLAAEIVLPMSPNAVDVQKTSVLEAIVSKPSISIPHAFTYASAAAKGAWEAGHSLTPKQKTPGPKAKASSGELRATATPFTPPAAGSSLLIPSTQVSFAAPLIPTYAQRAAAASVREEEPAALKSKETLKAQKASDELAAEKNGPKSGNSTAGTTNIGSTASSERVAVKIKQKQKGTSKLSHSDHKESKSVPASIDGSVPSPSIASARSLPTTPMVPTYAQRAATASLLSAAFVAMPKNEEAYQRSENIATPKPAKGPRPVPLTPTRMSPDSSPKTVRPLSLSATDRYFSYAAKLVAPVPPAMTHLNDGLPKEEGKALLQPEITKAFDSAPTSTSAENLEKKGPKNKDKKPRSALANGPPTTIDANAMTATSSDSARASVASTATTSASSATLVSSETISSESASSASIRTNSDVGAPFPVYRLKAPYQPARPMSEDEYRAPPPTPSPLETWAQKAGRIHAIPPPIGLQERNELRRESRLTTSTGARGSAGGRGHWRSGQFGQVRSLEESTEAEGDESQDTDAVIEKDQHATPGRTHTQASKVGSDEGAHDSRGPGSKAEVQGPAEDLRGSGGSGTNDEENPRLGKTKSQLRNQHGTERSFATGGSNADSRASHLESELQGHQQTKQEKEGQGGTAPARSRRSPDRGREAGDGDRSASGALEKPQEVPLAPIRQEPEKNDSAVGQVADLKSTMSSSAGGIDGTAKATPKTYKSKAERLQEKKSWKARLEHLKDQAGGREVAEARTQVNKAEKPNLSDYQAQETPKKISWADADDDEWAGFESLPVTIPEDKKESERKGG